MASFNKVILMGNLTRDPESRTTPGGLTICKIGLAVNRVYSTQEGEKKEEVTFVDCDAFGRQAETIAKYMSKGRGIMIEGRLRLDQWEDKQSGQNRSKLGVVIENFQFVGGRGDDSNSGGGGGGSNYSGGNDYQDRSPPARPQRAAPPPPQQNENFEDDVPF